MMDLISRQNVIDAVVRESQVDGAYGYMDTKSLVDLLHDMPTIKVQKTGKWIVHTEIENVYGGIYIECSECGESYVVQHLDAEIYCRTCGSKNAR